MGNKVYTAVVVLLWCATMSWLVCSKILPPFMRGEPPRAIHNANRPVLWHIRVGQQKIGCAVSQAIEGVGGTNEIHSRVILEDVPISRMAPRWMSRLIDNIGSLKVDMRTRTDVDSLGSLSYFRTSVEINDLPSAIRMEGRLGEGILHLRLQYGEAIHKLDYPWPKDAMMGSMLSPDATLLSVYKGRKWHKEVYNPFGGPHGAMEAIEAEVMDEEPLLIDGELVNTRRVEMRSIDSTGVSQRNRRRSTLWVAEDGRVLREEINLMDIQLTFHRASDDEAQRLADELLELDRHASTTTLAQQASAGEEPGVAAEDPFEPRSALEQD